MDLEGNVVQHCPLSKDESIAGVAQVEEGVQGRTGVGALLQLPLPRLGASQGLPGKIALSVQRMEGTVMKHEEVCISPATRDLQT